jgi:nucleoside-diphosphate-sugar epimerase
MNKKTALVLGGGGFIGSHMVDKLVSEGYSVRAADLKNTPYETSPADEFYVGDLRSQAFAKEVIDKDFDEVYQFAADMGGAGFVFTGENDYDIMHNSAGININVIDECLKRNMGKVFYSSSACMYPEHNQLDPNNPNCREDSAYPANPDSEYGWEKLFSERLYLAAARNKGLNARIARYHNIFGVKGSWYDGREKAPAALCRKVITAEEGSSIEVWGDGSQTRSFLYVDECIEATIRLTRSDFAGPVNIGSEEMISINELANMIILLSGKSISINNIDGPEGVRGRNSDNALYESMLGWKVSEPLIDGITKTYGWIEKQIELHGKDLGVS